MDTIPDRNSESSLGGRDRALSRILAEVYSGLRHGFFEYTLTCEVVGQGRRRLVLHSGKNYQFVISAEECESAGLSSDPRDEGAVVSRS